MTTNLELRSYTDYREYLRDYAARTRATRRGWTYGVWARRLGLKDTSSITKILLGQRDAGPQITESLIAYFAFTPADADYFRDLVRLRRVRDDARLSSLLRQSLSSPAPAARSSAASSHASEA